MIDEDIRQRALAWVRSRPETPVQAPKTHEPDAMTIAIGLCQRFEGFRATPYLCPAGVPTIGIGSTRYLDGRAVRLTDGPITRAEAMEILRAQLRRDYLPSVLRLCPEADTPERIGALLDFTYNLGAGALSASTLRQRVNAGRWEDVPKELRRWVYARGRVLRGLVLRREAEAMLI